MYVAFVKSFTSLANTCVFALNYAPPSKESPFVRRALWISRRWEPFPQAGCQRRVNFGAVSGFRQLGINHKFQQGMSYGTSQENKIYHKRVGNYFDSSNYVLSKDGSHFGSPQTFSGGYALSKRLHRSNVPLCATTSVERLGSTTHHPSFTSRGSQTTKYHHPDLEGEALPETSCCQASSPRPLSDRLGSVDIHTGNVVQEFWRGQNGLHINGKELQSGINTFRSLAKEGEVVNSSVNISVSFSSPSQGGGSAPPLQFSHAPISELVYGQKVSTQSKMGQVINLSSNDLISPHIIGLC